MTITSPHHWLIPYNIKNTIDTGPNSGLPYVQLNFGKNEVVQGQISQLVITNSKNPKPIAANIFCGRTTVGCAGYFKGGEDPTQVAFTIHFMALGQIES